MTKSRAVCTVAALAAVVVLAGGARVGAGSAGTASQIQAGDLATWADLSTWSNANRVTRQTEIGMGLIVDGSSGSMRLAFYVTQPTRGTAPEPSSIGVRVASSLRMDPNLLRSPTLIFNTTTTDEETDEVTEAEFDLSSSLRVDNPAPGAAITSGLTELTAEQFITIAESDSIEGTILGAEVEFREDQIEAILAFRERVLPPKK
jgi:hypothetical protein